MPSLSYEQVKEFKDGIEFVDSGDFEGFQKRFGVRKPEKECLIVHSDRDFFSDRVYAQSLMSSASVSELDAGVFGFFEKPQAFNKILHDFLLKIERKAVKESIELEKEKNRDLSEFVGSKGKRLAQVD
jgi:hypothetical protein